MIPKIYGFSAHWDSFNIKRVGKDRYVMKKDDAFYLIGDRCHHRGYHLFRNLRDNDNIDLNHYVCPVHGQKGLVDKLIIDRLTLDKSGLVTGGWRTDSTQEWVQQISDDGPFQHHSTVRFHNKGDWRFQTEMNADMYHLNYIHPWLKSTVDINAMRYTNNQDHLVQNWCDRGWWSIIYPFYQFEWQPGSVYFAEIRPIDDHSYDVIGDFYHTGDGESEDDKLFRELILHTYQEDLDHVADMGQFYGPYTSDNPLEDQVEHWHRWYWANRDHIVI
jgi:Rieske [2Fe-2S] domain